MELHDLVFKFHGLVSSLFTIIAIIILVRSIRGWKSNVKYTSLDKKLSAVFVFFLYLQLIVGVLLYFVIGNQPDGSASIDEATKQMSLRFWVLEHFIIMIFALFLSQLGWIFILKSKLDLNKHKNTIFYFGISILLIIISTGIGLIWR